MPHGPFTTHVDGGTIFASHINALGDALENTYTVSESNATFADKADTDASLDAGGQAESTLVINAAHPSWNIPDDGTTDASAEIQAMVNTIDPFSGAHIAWPSLPYVLNTGITYEGMNLSMSGTAAGQSLGIHLAGTRFLVQSGVVGWTIGDASADYFAGPKLRNLYFVGESGALGGLRLLRMSNSYLENVWATDFETAGSYGFKIDGGAGYAQYNTLVESGAFDCNIGLWITIASGTRLLGGIYDGNSNTASPPGTSSTGILCGTSAQSLRAFGTIVQLYDTGINLGGDDAHELHGVRWEANTTNLTISADRCSVFGGSMNNFLSGSTGTGINIDAAASWTQIYGPNIDAVTTAVVDAGTSTMIIRNREMQMGLMQFAGGGYIDGAGFGSGNVRLATDVWIQDELTVGAGGLTGLTHLGYDQAVNIRRVSGSPEGVVTAGPGCMALSDNGNIYRKGSGAGNTGWVAM